MKYQAPFGHPGGANDETAVYVDGNPAFGIRGSVIPAKSIEQAQRELVNLIHAVGAQNITNDLLPPDNNDLQQVTRAVRDQVPSFLVDGGTPNNIQTNNTGAAPEVGQYRDGMIRRVRVKFTNTGPMTYAEDGKSPVPIVRPDLKPVAIGEVVANSIITIAYDSAPNDPEPSHDFFQLLTVTQTGAFIGIIDDYLIKWIGKGNPAEVKGPDADTVTGVGRAVGADYDPTSPVDFSSFSEAVDWVSRYLISQTGFVEFQFTAGQHTIPLTVTIDHPSANKMWFRGMGDTSPPIYSAFATTPLPRNTTNLTTSRGNDLITLRGGWDTELRFTTAAQLSIRAGGARFTELLLAGDGSQTLNDWLVVAYAPSSFGNVAIHGAGGGGINFITTRGVVEDGTAFIVSGCMQNGVDVRGSLTNLGSIWIFSNGGNGMNCLGGALLISPGASLPMICQGNGASGFALQGNVGYAMAGSQFNYNGNAGVEVYSGSAYIDYLDGVAAAGEVKGNNHFGLWVNRGAIAARNVDVTATADGIAVNAAYGSNVSLLNGSVGGQTVSPPANNDGNYNSFVATIA